MPGSARCSAKRTRLSFLNWTTIAADTAATLDVRNRPVYSPLWGRVLAIFSVLIAVAAWVRVLRYAASGAVPGTRGVKIR